MRQMEILKAGGQLAGSPHCTFIQDKWGFGFSTWSSAGLKELSHRNPKALLSFVYLLYFYILTLSVSVSERRMSSGKIRIVHKTGFGDAIPPNGQELGHQAQHNGTEPSSATYLNPDSECLFPHYNEDINQGVIVATHTGPL